MAILIGFFIYIFVAAVLYGIVRAYLKEEDEKYENMTHRPLLSPSDETIVFIGLWPLMLVGTILLFPFWCIYKVVYWISLKLMKK